MNPNFEVIIKPSQLKGHLEVPPSKSMSHRVIMCAGLSSDVSKITNITLSEDISATLEAMKQFGCVVSVEQRAQGHPQDVRYTMTLSNPKMMAYARTGKKPIQEPVEIFCNESGSTARFMIPLFHLSENEVVFSGTERLSQRPYEPYYEIFKRQNIAYHTLAGGLPLKVSGALMPGHFDVVGNISSQFISGLMFSLPLLKGDSTLKIIPPVESRDYIALTLQCLRAFGIEITETGAFEYAIKGGQRYQACDMSVEGDYSQAAFWLVAAALGHPIRLSGLSDQSVQADRAIVQLIENARGDAHRQIDVSQFPDLVPVLTVLYALGEGTTEIVNAARLRIKESDRLHAIATELGKMGADIEEKEEGLVIRGVNKLKGAHVSSWNDHRIAMALAIAASVAEGETVIDGAECVQKSYPHFWEDYRSLGGDALLVTSEKEDKHEQ